MVLLLPLCVTTYYYKKDKNIHDYVVRTVLKPYVILDSRILFVIERNLAITSLHLGASISIKSFL